MLRGSDPSLREGGAARLTRLTKKEPPHAASPPTSRCPVSLQNAGAPASLLAVTAFRGISIPLRLGARCVRGRPSDRVWPARPRAPAAVLPPGRRCPPASFSWGSSADRSGHRLPRQFFRPPDGPPLYARAREREKARSVNFFQTAFSVRKRLTRRRPTLGFLSKNRQTARLCPSTVCLAAEKVDGGAGPQTDQQGGGGMALGRDQHGWIRPLRSGSRPTDAAAEPRGSGQRRGRNTRWMAATTWSGDR